MPQIEVSIIVQMREITDDGRSGRCAIGISKFQQPTGVPTKSWRESFDAAVRRSVSQRATHLAEIRDLVRPTQLTLGLQRVQAAAERAKKGVPRPEVPK
jgi:hypothetical protein